MIRSSAQKGFNSPPTTIMRQEPVASPAEGETVIILPIIAVCISVWAVIDLYLWSKRFEKKIQSDFKSLFGKR